MARKKGPLYGLGAFFARPVVILLTTSLAMGLLFPYVSPVQSFNLPEEGEVAKETVIAPFTFDIPKDPKQLERERRRAMDQVLLILDYDPEVKRQVRERFLELRRMVSRLGEKGVSDSLRDAARRQLSTELTESTLELLISRPYLLDDALLQAQQVLESGVSAVLLVESQEELEELQERYNTSFDRHLIYDKNFVTLRRDSIRLAVKHEELPVKEIALERVIHLLKRERKFDQEALSAVYELLFAYLRPNVTVNGEATARARQRASLEVLPIKGKVIKDTEIMRKHQVVGAETVEKLKALSIALQRTRRGTERWRLIAGYGGRALLGLFILLSLAVYIRTFRPDLMKNVSRLWALASLVIIQFAVIRGGVLLVPRLFNVSPEIASIVPEYIIPTAVAAILAAILFDLQMSALVSFLVSIYFGIVLGFNYRFFLYSLLGGLTAGFAHRDIRYRWDFFKAMPPVAGVYTMFILTWHLLTFELLPLAIVQNVGLALINVISATFIAMMLVAIFENLFGLSTNMTLVELADMNHPILKRLSIEAAGTYNHSVLVGNLAESAAEGIGANALLARVASYYHDIGKIEKADYFVENHINDKNIHNKLSPNMSALIICSHVKEGVELSRSHKLPRVVQDAVMQHHGTSTVSFFYEKALAQDPHKQVQEKDFRYPGPVPQTRENAIIMLADSVEAASRSLATSSPRLLRELVKKIIRDKLNAHQLDECDLTLRDLDKIVEGFMPVLQGIFHTRIEYPTKK